MNQSAPNVSRRKWEISCEMKLKEGNGKDAVLNAMLAEGCPPSDATMFLTAALKTLRGQAIKLTAGGAAFLLLGLMLTLSSYRTAYEAGGGRFFLFFGAMICGICCVFFGLRSFFRLK
ncbi:MAG: hypothetical protein FWC60_06590 [Firmicutes bacterium]|nr:hypothetical protein [Bacillota bacterium]